MQQLSVHRHCAKEKTQKASKKATAVEKCRLAHKNDPAVA